MKKLVFYGLLLCSVAMASCSKEKSIDTLEAVANTGGGGANGGNASNTYQPVTKGSYWKYKYISGMTGESDGSMSGGTKTVNTILFYEISSAANTSAKSYYGIKGANYFMLAQGVSQSGGAVDLTIHYLNDTASVGYTWNTEAGTGNGFDAYVDGEIKERGISLTVQGKTYKDVIHSYITLSYDIFGFFIYVAGSYDFYVAKNVGVVKCVTKIYDPNDGSVTSSITQELVTSTIK